jgi:hypothetical protein
MSLVQLSHKIAELRAEYVLHRPRFGRDDVDLDLAMAKRGGNFETYEAGADNDGPASLAGAGDQVAAVSE